MSTMSPPAVARKPEPSIPSDVAARDLRERLKSTHRRLIMQMIGVGICKLFAYAAVILLAIATVDYSLELDTVWRAAGLIGIVIFATVVGVMGWRRWISNYSLSLAAAETEARLSQFGQRLRTSLDYEQQSPPPAAASPSLLAALHVEAHLVSEQVEWDDAIDRRPLFNAALTFTAIVFGWLVVLLAVPEFRTATARSLLLPFDYTTVTFEPQTSTVRLGESVTVTAQITGRPVESANLRFRASNCKYPDEWKTVSLAPLESETPDSDVTTAGKIHSLHGELIATLKDLRHDLEFEVIAGPRPLSPGSIRVLQPLKLVKPESHIIPPAYTGRPDETVKSLDLKVLEGSTVELKLELNRAASTATLTRIENSKTDKSADQNTESATTAALPTEIPLKLQENLVLCTIADLRNSVSFKFDARAEDGMTLDPLRVNIRVQLDRKPQVQFIQPNEELVVTPTTEVAMIVEAGDDIGLHKVGVLYQIGDGPMKTLDEQDAAGATETVRLDPVLMLEEHELTYRDAVTYFAFAEDNYFGKPRRTTTPLRFIDIRPFKMKFQIVESNCPPCNGSSITLEELITRQRLGLTQAFALQQERIPPKEITQRLSKSQTEVLDATNELAMGMAKLGIDLPTLDDAIAAMEKAVPALDTARMDDAVSHEQKALSALIRARENIRKKLNQSNSQSASACRKFDREQRQKLRMPEKKKQDQQQQLASARSKLEDLAKRERKWSEQAKSSCQSSGSSSSSKSAKSSPMNPAQTSQQANPLQQSGDKQDQKPDTPSPAEVAEAQSKLQAELAELQKELEKLAAAGKAAQNQAQQAAESMQQGADQVKKQDGDAAAKSGQRSAEQLEQLSAHLAAMNAKDFGQRLDQAAKLAQQIADRQGSIEKQLSSGEKPGGESQPSQSADATGPSKAKNEGQGNTEASQESQAAGKSNKSKGAQPGGSSDREELAQRERALAAQTEMLADLLDALKSEAAMESSSVREKLDQVQTENPPRDIAANLQKAAEELNADRPREAGQSATQARRQLDELSRGLGAARIEHAQPQLKELMGLEEQLAQLQKQMQRAKGQNAEQTAALAQKWQQLEARLEKLANGDQRLADAMKKLREGSAGKAGAEKPATTESQQSASKLGGTTPPKPGSQLSPTPFVEGGATTPEGFYSWLELGNFQGMREVSKALQMKIQEAILAAALLDADQPVPPAYKSLVEKYYRTLSDDLK